MPAYLFQLEKVHHVVETLRAEVTQHKVTLVDYTAAEVDDLRKQLSHACLLLHVLLGCDPPAGSAGAGVPEHHR